LKTASLRTDDHSDHCARSRSTASASARRSRSSAVGNIDATAVEAEFRALATKHGIEADVVNALVKHHKGRLG